MVEIGINEIPMRGCFEIRRWKDSVEILYLSSSCTDKSGDTEY